jgi:hypothetical protein
MISCWVAVELDRQVEVGIFTLWVPVAVPLSSHIFIFILTFLDHFVRYNCISFAASCRDKISWYVDEATTKLP